VTLLRIRSRGVWTALLAVLLLALFGADHAVADGEATTQISGLKTEPGTLQFVFSAANLPTGATLDPKSVLVTANDTPMSSTASPPQTDASSGAVPSRVVILTLDVSGSMAGSGISAARAAALAYAVNLPDDVRVGLVTFSTTPHTLLAPTTSRPALRSAINKVQSGGDTALYDGVIAAARILEGQPKNAVRRLVVLSDGDDTVSAHPLTDATSMLVRDGIAADVVAFRIPGDQTVLNQIAATSRGQVLPASGAGDLADAFTAAAKEFEQRVLVTVTVPDSLAGQPAHLVASMTAGGQSLSAKLDTTLPVSAAAEQTSPLSVSPPAGSTSTVELVVICGVAFVSILIAALLGLFAPLTARVRASKQSRLAEVNRYRLLGAIGKNQSATPAGPSETELTRRALSLVDKAVRARGQRERLVSELDRAGVRLRPEEWVVIQVGAIAFGAAILGVATSSPIGLLPGGLLGWMCCRLFIRMKIANRAAAFVDQLPDTLQLVSGSLRSGFSLNQALVGVVREGSEPTASEFARALAEVRLGSELDDAIDDVSARMQCDDLHWVVMAVRISREVGGNLAEVLQNVVTTMRDRAQLRGQVRVLSAEGRISAKILIGLPFVLAAYLLVFKHGYLDPLFNTGTGIAMLVTGSVLLMLGALWLSRLVKIEV
jgi:Flp pilus assembly protein TadB